MVVIFNIRCNCGWLVGLEIIQYIIGRGCDKMTKRFTTKNGVFYTDNLTGWEFQSYGEVVKLMNELNDENEQLKQTLEDLRTYSNDEIKEAKHINTIYKEQGFKGVIDCAKDKLQNYGVVREVENGLWVMVTGGWSDNEFWLHCLNNPVSVFGIKHYRGYLRGGAFYYTEKPRGDVEIRLKGDVE